MPTAADSSGFVLVEKRIEVVRALRELAKAIARPSKVRAKANKGRRFASVSAWFRAGGRECWLRFHLSMTGHDVGMWFFLVDAPPGCPTRRASTVMRFSGPGERPNRLRDVDGRLFFVESGRTGEVYLAHCQTIESGGGHRTDPEVLPFTWEAAPSPSLGQVSRVSLPDGRIALMNLVTPVSAHTAARRLSAFMVRHYLR
jgi:hypothetical protein